MRFITPEKPIDCPKIWKDFTAPAGARAVLTLMGLGLYRAFLNGQRVGREYLTPGFNDYDAYLRAQTWDVTDLLAENNRLEVWLGNGWYKGRLGLGESRGRDRWGSRYLLAARLEIAGADGSLATLETDETWLAGPSPIVDGGIYDGEIRDDTRQTGESAACVPAVYSGRVEPWQSPPIRAYAERKPVLLHTPAGEQVLDFGQNLAGIIRFVNRLPRCESLRIQSGEVLQGGNFYRDNLRSAKSEYVYTSDGVEKEIEPLFTFYGFRYAKVEGLARVDPADFTAVALSSDLEQTLRASTGHAKLNRLMENAWWGQRSNFLDVPTDCPQRDERMGWTADTQVFVNTACYQMDCKAFYRKFMRDMREDQLRYYGGDIPAYSPSVKGEAIHGGAVWADAGTIIPWNVYMAYGDQDLLRENYPMMRDYAEYLIRADAAAGGSHIVFPAFTFGDWVAQDGMTPQSVRGGTLEAYIQGIYYMHSVDLTARAAAELGEAADARRYEALAEEIRAALLAEYFTPGGNLCVDTQTAYVLALHYGVYRNEEKLLQGFRRRLQRDFYRITCGFTGTPLILSALMDHGMEEEAFRMLLTEEFPGWLYAVNLGATTIWERWNSLNPDGSMSGTGMNSLNHYAYGSVCEAIYSRVMGLRCGAPGWKRAIVSPHISARLGHAELRYASAAGVWECGWRISPEGSVTLRLTVPEGAEADVTLPDHPEGLRQTVGAGEHTWTWRPLRDVLHPFSRHSLMGDLMEDPRAAALMQKHMPARYAACLGRDSESRALRLEESGGSHPVDEKTLAVLERELRQVRVDPCSADDIGSFVRAAGKAKRPE